MRISDGLVKLIVFSFLVLGILTPDSFADKFNPHTGRIDFCPVIEDGSTSVICPRTITFPLNSITNDGDGTATFSEINDLESDGTSGIADAEIFIGTGAGTGNYAVISGDGSLANTGALTVSNLTCTDCLNETEIDDIYMLNSGDTGSGDYYIYGNFALGAPGFGLYGNDGTSIRGIFYANYGGGASDDAIFTVGGDSLFGGSSQGVLKLNDGSNNHGALETASLSADRTYTFPNETGTVCTTGSVCSGYESSTSNDIDPDRLAGDTTDNNLIDSAILSEADPNALLTAGTDNVKDTHIDWGSGAGQVNASDVPMSMISGSTYSTIEDMQLVFHSAGYVSGGTINDNGGGTITVDAGTGLIRSTDSALGTIFWFDWSALGSTAITTDTIRYVGVEYNAGSPQVVVHTSYDWDFHTNFPLGSVVNEGGTLHIINAQHTVGDHAGLMIQRAYQTMPFSRDARTGGIILGESGTRNVSVTAGTIWERLQPFTISAIDTAVSGSFDRYYRNGSGGWTREASQTQWPNTQYDNNSGTLATMINNRYANLWFYIELDGNLVMLYGQNEYTSSAGAEAAAPPSSVPNRISAHGKLIGRIIFQKSASSATTIQSVFTTTFQAAQASDHGNLAGLTDDDHSQYLLSTGDSGFFSCTTRSCSLDASGLTSANVASAVSDETGTGSLVFANSPAFTTPNIGTATGSVSGNAGTATALAANGANCSAGNAPLGVDASGAAESCTDFEEDLANMAGLETAVGGANVIQATEIDTSAEIAAIVTDETGSGSLVFATSPTLVTPTLGVASSTSVVGSVTLAGNPTLGANTCTPSANGLLCEGTVADTFEGLISFPVTTSDKTFTIPNETGTAYTTASASKTSSALATTISDETGTGALVFATSPAFTTPNIGSATGSITGNAGTATALAANGANCSAGNSPLGVDASGAVEGCFAVITAEVDGSTTNEIQNLFETISTTSGTAPVADTATDTLTLTAGTGITVTGDSATDTVTIASTITDTDTNANTICSGTTTYLDGEGNCDDISSVYEPAFGDIYLLNTGDTIAAGGDLTGREDDDGFDSWSLTSGTVAGNLNILRAGGPQHYIQGAAATVFNEQGVDVDFRIEGVGVSDAFQVDGTDGAITLGALGAGVLRSTAGGVISSSALDHGADIGGLTDDDHTQYALLAGRSGGQTIYGGTGSGDTLNIYSTSHSTKGIINIADTAYVDKTNGRLGVGIATPGLVFHVQNDGSSGLMGFDTYFNGQGGSLFMGRHARGSAASPSALNANDVMASLVGRSYNSSGTFTGVDIASIQLRANEAQTSSAMGTHQRFFTTPNGSTSPAEAMRIQNDGNLSVGTTSSVSKITSSGEIAIADGMTAPSSTSGYAKIFVDSADGDLKVIFGDGTTKTIVADT